MSGVLGCDLGQGRSDGGDQVRRGPGFCAAQAGFDFAPHLFDRVEVWGVGGQEEDLRAGLRHQGQGGIALVRRKVVHDDDVSTAQRRAEDFCHVGAKDFRVGGTRDGHGCGGAVETDGGDHGGGLPAAARRAGMAAPPARGAPVQAGQVRFRPALVEEDEPRRVEAGLPPPPPLARPGDVRTVLLAGAQCLFLYESPIFTSV